MPQTPPNLKPQTKPDQQRADAPTPMPPRRTWGIFLLILLINFLLFRMLFPSPDMDTVPYTVFKQQAAGENVEAVFSRGERITGRFRTAITYPAEPDSVTGEQPRSVTTFETTLPTFLDPGLEALLIAGGTEIRAEPIEEGMNPLWMLLFGFGPAILFIGLYIWFIRRIAKSGGIGGMMGGMRNMSQSTARRFDQSTDEKVTFEDVAGIEEAENELVEVVDFLKNPEKYTRLGGTAPKGVLLVGPPGTGKTLLARAVAGEAGVAFYSMSGSEFVEMMGGMRNMSQSTARRFDQSTDEKVTFEDVAGIEEAENELVEVVDFLKNPEKYTRLGGTAPKGVLLVGPPGTGKTLLARAVAGEAGVAFYSMSGSEFVEMIVGVGAARVRDLFKQAREHAPAIIFIDEIDSIGRARGQAVVGGASEQEQTLNQLLAEMDGFSSREGIVVLAATNQPDVLDRALMRAGRFDRRVVVNLPDRAGRTAILKVHTRKVPLAVDVNHEEIASVTPGFSGADIRNLVNEAALLAARRGNDAVHNADFLDSLEKIILGPERPLLLKEDDRRRIAYHEGGHAILGLVVPGADPVHRVTIIPRGMALGVTYQRPEEDRYNYPEDYLRARLVGIMGGRAAEEIAFGTRTTGAENDIEQATQLAHNMVTRWGMSDKLGMIRLAGRDNPYLGGADGYAGSRVGSEDTNALVDEEVRAIINESYDEARRLLEIHRDALDRLVDALLERETLDEQEILEVTGLTHAQSGEGQR